MPRLEGGLAQNEGARGTRERALLSFYGCVCVRLCACALAFHGCTWCMHTGARPHAHARTCLQFLAVGAAAAPAGGGTMGGRQPTALGGVWVVEARSSHGQPHWPHFLTTHSARALPACCAAAGPERSACSLVHTHTCTHTHHAHTHNHPSTPHPPTSTPTHYPHPLTPTHGAPSAA